MKKTEMEVNEIVTLDLTKEYDFIPKAQRGKEKARVYYFKGIPNRKLAQFESNINKLFFQENAVIMRSSEIYFEIACAYISNIENLIINGKAIDFNKLEEQDKNNLFDTLSFDELQEVGEYIFTISKFPELLKVKLGKQ
jgi:hypothetical protein